jgi:MFS family permease
VKNIAAESDQLNWAYAKVSRHILPMMLLAYIVAYLDRVNVGFAKLQMLSDLGFSETMYGLGAGIFFLGYFLFGVPSNLILHRFGARRWIALLMIVWGIISGSMMWVRSPASYYGFRFALGVAEAGFFPGVIFYFTQWYPATRRGRVTAMFMSAIAVCSVIGSVLSGWIMQSFNGAHGWAGWQWLFILEAAPAVLIGLCLLIWASDSISGASWLTPEEKALLAADLVRDAGPQAQGTFVDAFRDPRVWIACLIYFCAMTGLYGISFWLPTIIKELGVQQPLQIGLVTAIPYSVAAVGMVFVGHSADRRNERRWHVALPAAAGAWGLALSVLLAAHGVAAIVALSFAAFGIFTTPPLFWSLPTAYLRGPAAASGIAFINSFGCLAGFASPYTVGWLKDVTHSTGAGMYLVAGFVFVGAVLVIACTPAPDRAPAL